MRVCRRIPLTWPNLISPPYYCPCVPPPPPSVLRACHTGNEETTLEYVFNRFVVSVLGIFVLVLIIHIVDLLMIVFQVCRKKGVGTFFSILSTMDSNRKAEALKKQLAELEAKQAKQAEEAEKKAKVRRMVEGRKKGAADEKDKDQ